jgi:uncharacterized membrane protein YhaH (DUF805 family)
MHAIGKRRATAYLWPSLLRSETLEPMVLPPAPAKVATVAWALFGFDGRISRQVFWLGFLLMTSLASIAMTPYRDSGIPQEPDAYFLGLVGVALWSEVALVIKRLHDRGLTGFFSLVLALPIVNFVAFVVLGLIPGEAGPNRYGPGPDRRASR